MRLGGAAITAALAIVAILAAAQAATAPGPFRIRTRPVPLDVDQPGHTRVGALTWAGGLVLTAPGERRFGGLSGIDVDGTRRFLAQSDAGALVGGRLRLDPAGRLVGIDEPTLSRLTDTDGKPYPERKYGADAEDITFMPGGGYAISFEGRHRVQAYAPDGTVRRLDVAPEIASLYANGGIEALAAWTDPAGRPRLVEGVEDGRAWSCDLDGEGCHQILAAADAPPGYRLTGLDALPASAGQDGAGLVAVYRGFDLIRGFRAIVAWVRPGTAQPVTVLARLEPPYTVDNMEGIAAVPNADGSIRLYLVSDDNFLNLERTLLLAFDWRR